MAAATEEGAGHTDVVALGLHFIVAGLGDRGETAAALDDQIRGLNIGLGNRSGEDCAGSVSKFELLLRHTRTRRVCLEMGHGQLLPGVRKAVKAAKEAMVLRKCMVAAGRARGSRSC